MSGATHLTRLEERFGAAPAIEVARSGLRDVSDRAWLVGGAVRDAVLGGDVVDVDIAFDGDVAAAARDRRRGRRPPVRALRAISRPGGSSTTTASWKVDVAALARRVDRARSAAARLHGQRDCGAARRRRADRPDRRPARPRGGHPPRLLGALVRRRPAAGPPRGRASRPGSGFEPEPETVALARREAPRAAEPAGRAAVRRARRAAVGARAARRTRDARPLRGDRGRPPRGRRDARRRPERQPPPRRPRPHDRGPAADARGRARPADLLRRRGRRRRRAPWQSRSPTS